MASGRVLLRSCIFYLLICLWLIPSLLNVSKTYSDPSRTSVSTSNFELTDLRRRNRPIYKFLKHGHILMDSCSCFLLRSGDVPSNPGPRSHLDSSLTCFMQNVRSLKAITRSSGSSFECKTKVLQDIASSYDLDLIFLTETWLNDSINSNEVLPFGYDIYRKDRLNQVGGGVLIAVKSCDISSEVHIPSELEVILITVQVNRNKKLLFINCYRPPNLTEFIPKFHSLLSSVDLSLYAGVFIVGDFNYPDIQWIEGSGFTTSFSGDEQALANLFLDYNFFQFVDRPTRNANLLDLVFTNSPELL